MTHERTVFKHMIKMLHVDYIWSSHIGAAVGITLDKAQAQLCMVDDMVDLSLQATAYARARGENNICEAS